MRELKNRTRAAAIFLALSFLALGPSAGATIERQLNADLVGAFAFGPCAPGAPQGARCLHDSVRGPISYLGDSTGEFDVVIDAAAIGTDGCAPVTKRGFFIAADRDRLNVTAQGRYCFATSAATYAYTLAGGSGRFAAATGKGSWLVPAPSSFNGTSGEGEETLRGTIAFDEPAATPIGPQVKGQLRFGHIRRVSRRRLRARVISNRRGLQSVEVTVHRGSPRGRTLGRSDRFSVSTARVVTIRLGHRLRRGRRYVAKAVGRDREGRRVSVVRPFRLCGWRRP